MQPRVEIQGGNQDIPKPVPVHLVFFHLAIESRLIPVGRERIALSHLPHPLGGNDRPSRRINITPEKCEDESGVVFVGHDQVALPGQLLVQQLQHLGGRRRRSLEIRRVADLLVACGQRQVVSRALRRGAGELLSRLRHIDDHLDHDIAGSVAFVHAGPADRGHALREGVAGQKGKRQEEAGEAGHETKQVVFHGNFAGLPGRATVIFPHSPAGEIGPEWAQRGRSGIAPAAP